MSLGQLSLRSGVTKATLSRWEAGVYQPRLPELGSVLDALGASRTDRTRCLQTLHAPRAVAAARSEKSVALHLSLGDLLYGLRARAGETQETVARTVGVSRALFRKWEYDDCVPSEAQIHTICFALDATSDEVVTLTTRRFADVAPDRSRDAILHRVAMTAYWDEAFSAPLYRLMLTSYLALLGRQTRQGKADNADLALLFTKLGDSATFLSDDEAAATHCHARARAYAERALEPVHFHVIGSARALLDERANPAPLRQRVDAALAWKPRFPTNAGKAYLLMFIAKEMAKEEPDEALRMADEYCALVAGDADEYPCRLSDRGRLLNLCGRPAEAVAFVQKLTPQDDFRAGLQQLDLARGLIALGSVAEAGQCVDAAKRVLSPKSRLAVTLQIADLERDLG